MRMTTTIAMFATIPYAIGFALFAFLPGTRSLLLFALAALALSVWALDDAARADGPASCSRCPLIIFTALGFFAGFLARAAVLAGRAMSLKFAQPGLLLPVVFVGVFGCFLRLDGPATAME